MTQWRQTSMAETTNGPPLPILPFPLAITPQAPAKHTAQPETTVPSLCCSWIWPSTLLLANAIQRETVSAVLRPCLWRQLLAPYFPLSFFLQSGSWTWWWQVVSDLRRWWINKIGDVWVLHNLIMQGGLPPLAHLPAQFSTGEKHNPFMLLNPLLFCSLI